jgi:biopolymer transport protein ExbB/TolQ
MAHKPSHELLYQVFALLLAVILVHALYVLWIRPQAELALAAQLAAAGDPGAGQQSLFVILKDYEQETCLTLALWALAIMAYKARDGLLERRLLARHLLPTEEGTRILPEDTRQLSRPLEALAPHERELLLPRALRAGLRRFHATRSIQDTAASVGQQCDSEADRLDSELAMIRYITWAIPSIGFIGTVRGIGMALSRAHEAVGGNIAGVTEALGVAFNSTFVALVLSIVVMFCMHQLQLLQERLVLDTQSYCELHLIDRLKAD